MPFGISTFIYFRPSLSFPNVSTLIAGRSLTLHKGPKHLGLKLSNFEAVFWDKYSGGLLLCQQRRTLQIVYVRKSLAKWVLL